MVGISTGSCHTILLEDLGMHQVPAKFVPRLLTDNQEHHFSICENLPYSPDLSFPDLFLFPKLKMTLKGRRFQTVEDIIRNVTNELKAIQQPSNSTSKVEKGSGSSALLSKGIALKGIILIKL
jgi:hypothetical protein